VPKKQELVDFLTPDTNVGVLLMTQMGGAPEELQLIIQTATYDESIQGLRERQAYIVRALGVKEHRVSMGVFNNLFIASEHPILYHHNAARHKVLFEGNPADANALVLDIQATYGAVFGPWRDLAEDLNREKPLFDLVTSGAGELGVMPEPAAKRLLKVFEHHKMTATLEQVEAERTTPDDDDKASVFETDLKILALDDSYFVAYSFVVDHMNVRG
jgi:hypothetical protein